MEESKVREVLKNYFEQYGVAHIQIDSYNEFISKGIQRAIDEKSDISVQPKTDTRVNFHFGNVFVSNPIVIDEDRSIRALLPNEARDRELCYQSTVYIDITEQHFENENLVKQKLHQRIPLLQIPTMIGSCICNLTNKTKGEKISAIECRYDPGGYFIIKGKEHDRIKRVIERVIVSQQRPNYNFVQVIEQNITNNTKYKYISEIRSVAEESGYSVVVQTLMPLDERTVYVSLPNIKEHIEAGIVFKALGISTEDISKMINMKYEKGRRYVKSILKATYLVETREDALTYISKYPMYPIPKEKQEAYARQVVERELFPHLGILSTTRDKAEFLAYMINKLICVCIGIRKDDDRDNVANKRIETTGILLFDLFRSVYDSFIKNAALQLQKKLDIVSIISHYTTMTKAIKTCFSTGNWSTKKTTHMKVGVSQVLNRMTYAATLSHLRHIVIPIGKEGKNAKIRQINTSQFGFICPAETPEGGTCGIVTNFSLLTKVSKRTSTILTRESVVACAAFSKEMTDVRVLLNGNPIGFASDSDELLSQIFQNRKDGLIDSEVSAVYNEDDEEIVIYCDEGRLLRPVFVVKDGVAYDGPVVDWDTLIEMGAIRYVDPNEIEHSTIAMDKETLMRCDYHYDFLEIHPSMLLGVCASIIPFPDHSQSPRNCYQCIWKEEKIIMADNTVKKIQDIQIGDYVRSIDPSTLTSSNVKVIHCFTKTTDKQMMRLTTFDKKQLVCTFDHPILALKNGIPAWVKTSDLKTGDKVGIYETNKKCIFMPLISIEDHANVEISDITVDSDNHSFVIDNGIIVHNSSMAKQALGVPLETYDFRADTMMYVMDYPQRPLVSTDAAEFLNFNEMPSGCNPIVAIMTKEGFNQEDSVILNKSSIERGMFRVTGFFTISDEEVRKDTANFQVIEIPNMDIRNKKNNYAFLHNSGPTMGIIKEGSHVKKDDVLISKVSIRIKKSGEEEKKDISLTIKSGEEGIIHKVRINSTPKGGKIIKIVIRVIKTPEVGDKFASRAAQKGTCGMIFSQEDMPFTSDGITPDIIINPHCIPSRMTINQLMECVLGKSCSLEGKFGNATPFSSHSVNVAERLCNDLESNGFERHGLETMFNPYTGEELDAKIFIGPTYYQRLKHMVSDKMHSRARGHVTMLTRQPVEGRSRDGGLRFGEMERDAIIVHGTSRFLKERLFDMSDPYNVIVCTKCGMISASQTECKGCVDDKVTMINIPYAAKLLFQELMAMGIKTELIPKQY
jgi:DNA-directed RNA polymerase beta subunit